MTKQLKEKTMTLEEAYKVLRTLHDVHTDVDYRLEWEAISAATREEAFQLILESQGLTEPIADCRHCWYGGKSTFFRCTKGVVGVCTKFKRRGKAKGS